MAKLTKTVTNVNFDGKSFHVSVMIKISYLKYLPTHSLPILASYVLIKSQQAYHTHLYIK